jgi:AbrB family looped-hinge helix DNA binding protein
MLSAMRITMDAAGRLVIPHQIRREAGLAPGMPLDIRLRDGRIEIEPEPLPVKLVRRGRLLVAVPQQHIPPLRPETVERTRRMLRRERAPGP